MWVDDRGVFHTVALPEPTDLMALDFRDSFAVLVANDVAAVEAVVTDEADRFYKEARGYLLGTNVEFDYCELIPPRDLVRGNVHDLSHLRRQIREVEWRWRLDVLTAIEDYVDILREGAN